MKFQPIISKLKSVASSNLWTKTSGVVVFVFGSVAVAADALEIKEKLFGTDINEEQVINLDSVQASKVLVDSTTSNVLKTNKTQVTRTPTKTVVITKKAPKIIYFNENEFLLENSGMAMFIKNGNNQLDQEFQQKVSANFLGININTTTSFFTSQSLPYYNQFYSANENFLKLTNVGSHLNKYMIGTLRMVKSNSSADTDIVIVNLRFKGKIVDVKTKTSRAVFKEVRETSYQEFRAVEDAYDSLSKEIITVF